MFRTSSLERALVFLLGLKQLLGLCFYKDTFLGHLFALGANYLKRLNLLLERFEVSRQGRELILQGRSRIIGTKLLFETLDTKC
jgi:hypothetical protein